MIAVYPGSFDPATNGHLDIMMRASKLVQKLYVSVLNNSAKKAFFTVEERMAQLRLLTKDIDNIEVTSFSGLLVDFAEAQNANVIIRGLRAVTDFEYEFQLALTNKSLKPDIETLFISANTKYLYLSSSVLKEVAFYGGNIDEMLPAPIKEMVLERLRKNT